MRVVRAHPRRAARVGVDDHLLHLDQQRADLRVLPLELVELREAVALDLVVELRHVGHLRRRVRRPLEQLDAGDRVDDALDDDAAAWEAFFEE